MSDFEETEPLEQIRQAFHSRPEVSGEEKETAKRVISHLLPCKPVFIREGLGGHGVLAQWDSGESGPHLLFRSELDALPILEENDLPYASIYEGFAHSCGHDGHTTILLGLARNLHKLGLQRGKVSLLFQPAEENGEGARAVLQDPAFADIRPDFVLALHNLPGYAMGEWILRDSVFSADVVSQVFHFRGKTAHAGEPENGVNPAAAMAGTLLAALAMEQPDYSKADYVQVTPVYQELGSRNYGISAGSGCLHLTIRCWDEERLNKVCTDLEAIARAEGAKTSVKVEIDYTQRFEANRNSPELVDKLKDLMQQTGRNFRMRPYPYRWGEDFGVFTKEFGGVMLGLGSGEKQAALHNPDFDFPDALLPEGVGLWVDIVNQWNR